jgi:hypothetical protein
MIITGHKKGIMKIWNKTLEPKPAEKNSHEKKGI